MSCHRYLEPFPSHTKSESLGVGKNKYIFKNPKCDLYELQLERVELDIIQNKLSVGDRMFTSTAVSTEPCRTVLVTSLQGETDPLINTLQHVNLTN